MKRTAMVRDVTLGAIITGLVPLASAAGAAGAGDSPASLCRSTLGENGPAGGPVVGEGPSGDPMTATIGWEPTDWMDGLQEIVTCVSVDGRLDSGLTTSTVSPFNTGTLGVNLTLPNGSPGALVCEQSILVGSGRAEGRHKPTSPVCFKLRTAEALAGSAPVDKGQVGPPAPVSAPAPKPPASSPAPGRKSAPAPTPTAPETQPSAPAPTPYQASTPPARAAFEASRAGVSTPAATRAVLPAAAEVLSAPTADETARAGAAISSPRTDPLPRTGLDNRIPMAAAGTLLALGGAALILGEPRRRGRPAARLAF